MTRALARRARRLAAALTVLALAAGCRTLAAAAEPRSVVIDTATGAEVDLDTLAERLADADVVFLGELHDSDPGHRFQYELTRRLLALRPRAAVSFEMFERDVQPQLDAYLAGALDEEAFLAASRPWPHYREHYRPVLELARARGLPVLAANVPRPLASRVAREGLPAVMGEEHMPRIALAPRGTYRDRFGEVAREMAAASSDDAPSHLPTEAGGLQRIFAAQCVKDEVMAESIADLLRRQPGTLVVHLCGRFHSDERLGTVERLLRREPWLDVRVVSMASRVRDADGRAGLAARDLARGDYLLLVPASSEE